jgi:hypothetical protein
LLDAERLGPPFVDVQRVWYAVIAAPPLNGAYPFTTIRSFPAVIVGVAGRAGAVAIITASDFGESGPAPLAFDPYTLQLYVLPFVNAVTAIGEASPVLAPESPPFVDEQPAV